MIIYVIRKVVALACGVASGVGFWKLSDKLGGYYGDNTPFYRNAKKFDQIQKLAKKHKEAVEKIKSMQEAQQS